MRCARTTAPAPVSSTTSTRPISSRQEDHDSHAALWGSAGIAQAAAAPLDTWKQWAANVDGMPVDYGHFLTEENPDVTAKALREFFAG